jgi:hypothetical protein
MVRTPDPLASLLSAHSDGERRINVDQSIQWWLPSLVGVSGVVLGTLLSMFGTRLSDRRRAEADRLAFERTQQSAREHELRRAASDLLIAARQYVGAYRSNFVRTASTDGKHHTYSPAEGTVQLNDISTVYDPYWTVVFLGSDAQRKAARDLMTSVRVFKVRRAQGGGLHGLSDREHRVFSDRYVATRSAFVESMRVEVQERSSPPRRG